MMRAQLSARILARGLCAGGLACLALITLSSPGATRMYAWPWSWALGAALLAPVLLLILRSLDRHRPLLVPALPWTVTAVALAGTIVLSALCSPFRGPSVLWGAPLLAGIAIFFVVADWLHSGDDDNRREQLTRATLVGGALVAIVGMGIWAARFPESDNWFDARNPYPLGHSNYTAGLALIMLPSAVVSARRHRGVWRLLAIAVIALALAQLFTCGSRGGFVGLAVLAAAAVWFSPLSRARQGQLAAAGLVAAAAFAFAHPRTRATLLGGSGARVIASSELQRAAMRTAGWRMGANRPLLGWGPGTTPLVYPKYRAGLPGGNENVLQLHSVPVQIWAELGAAGVACLLACGVLVGRQAARDPTASITLIGYGALALTDWQLDIPVFALALATCAARLAPPAPCHRKSDMAARRRGAWLLGGLAVGGLAIVALAGRPDPTPEMNLRALALGRDPAHADDAIALFRASLAQNPDQELPHFNLGWLLVVRAPAAAEKHFRAAAHLVPDKGGVYFGLGLAHLNQGRPAAAARAFALECLNDPGFLASPWWREPALAAVREASATAFAQLLPQVAAVAPPHPLKAEQLGRVPAGPVRFYRRERTGYPVLMRNLDLPTPIDLYEVREVAGSRPVAAPLPTKGWLPSPVLLALLDSADSAKP